MNKPLRSFVALSISLTLTALSPGGAAWAQFARTAAPTVAPVGAGSLGAAGAVPVKMSVPTLSNSAAPVLPSASLPGAVSPRVSVVAPAAAAPRAITVSAVMPILPAAAAYSLKKDKGMPDETGPRRDEGPDGTDGIDEIGNPRRRGGEGGPDDATDPDQGGDRGGNDGLFSGLKGLARAPTSLPRFFDVSMLRSGAAPSIPAFAPQAAPRSTLPQSRLAAPSLAPASALSAPLSPANGATESGRSWRERLSHAGAFLNTWTGALALTAAGLAFAGLTGRIDPMFLTLTPLYVAFIVPSLILHEMGHAKAAEKLGDPTARLQGRLDWSVKGLLTHLSPLMTVAIPLLTLAFTGLLFGGAAPVNVNERNLAEPKKDMAIIALAGPAVNFGLAAVGGVVAAGLVASGAASAAVLLAGSFVMFNVMLAVFNLLPLAPLDGHHVVRHIITDVFKAPKLAALLDDLAPAQLSALIALIIYGGATIGAAISGLTAVFMLPAALLTGVLSAMPLAAPAGPANAAAPAMPESKLVLVQLAGARRPLASDIHLGAIDVRKPGGMRFFGSQQDALGAELEAAGLSMASLTAYNASPVASYRRINTATVRVPVSSADAFKAEMESRGHKVYENAPKSIVRPIEDMPGYVRPEGFFGGISMKDTLKLSTMDKVHEIARGLWGAPGVGFRGAVARAMLRLGGAAPVQPKVAVIDTGVDPEHRLIKPGLAGHKDVQPGGDGIDDNGHGTWVTSMVLNYAPWLKSVTHYKAFKNGGATTDDVLKALTMAANDGNIIMSNSWGDDGGDPDGPDSQLVAKLASEGRIMVFAAGNNGYSGANTVGSPAIATYKDAATGAVRVIAVAATDANKKVTSFSSKGPGSAVTRTGGKWENYPVKPDLAEQGDNTEGAWPGGRTRSISGTSMSTPKEAGTIAMLAQIFGVTEVGEKLDRIVLAVFATLTNERNQTEAALGKGFNAAKAAYDKLLAEGFAPAAPGWVARLALRIAGDVR